MPGHLIGFLDMIKELKSRLDVMFDAELDGDHHWLMGFNDDGTYAYSALKIEGKEAVIHLNVIRWNKGILKEMLADWEEILYACRNAGATSIIAANKDYLDKRWPKLIKYFGFDKPTIVAISKQEI